MYVCSGKDAAFNVWLSSGKKIQDFFWGVHLDVPEDGSPFEIDFPSL